jgi:hypothetical protein
LALACGLKQFAWILVPFYLAYVFAGVQGQSIRVRLKETARQTSPFFCVTAILFVPFLIWDAKGLFFSLITVQTTLYPFRPQTLGLANFLIFLRAIEHYRDSFPLYVFYIVVVFPVLIFGVYRVLREASLSSAAMWYSTSLLLFLFFGRHFAPSYLIFLFPMLAVPYVVAENEQRRVSAGNS